MVIGLLLPHVSNQRSTHFVRKQVSTSVMLP
jgi:hypothetical protein